MYSLGTLYLLDAYIRSLKVAQCLQTNIYGQFLYWKKNTNTHLYLQVIRHTENEEVVCSHSALCAFYMSLTDAVRRGSTDWLN